MRISRDELSCSKYCFFQDIGYPKQIHQINPALYSNAYLVSFWVHQKLIDVRLNSGSNERKILLFYFSQVAVAKRAVYDACGVLVAIAVVAPSVSHAISTPSRYSLVATLLVTAPSGMVNVSSFMSVLFEFT
ncbi:hypothetical protein [Nostoc commune]|uniref:hypothetical protein n=1 Tax=Nostoc commune TaxID=1178 RepID=UPI002073817F|nr:hypothetical protein [Nostoc commune]